jgi:hypothetical protein
MMGLYGTMLRGDPVKRRVRRMLMNTRFKFLGRFPEVLIVAVRSLGT